MLPSSVVEDLDRLFKRFLWNAGDSAKGKARIAWKVVCRPKEQGGLGIKSLKKWNIVMLVKQFWKISSQYILQVQYSSYKLLEYVIGVK